jgi:hypothetical protein
MQEVLERMRDNMPAVKQGDEPGTLTSTQRQGAEHAQTNLGECVAHRPSRAC